MTDKPHFFIIIPSFNQGSYIRQTVESVLQQTNVHVTCLVFDGGSSDNTLSVLKTFGSRIKVVSEPDRGQTHAINKGIAEIRRLSKNPDSEVWAYLNSDDYYLPHALERVASELLQQPARFWLTGECLIVNQAGQEIQQPIRYYKRLWRSWMTFSTLLILNPIPQPATFMKVSALLELGEMNEHLQYTMDYDYWLKMWKKFGAPLISPAKLAAFRVHQTAKGTLNFKAQFAEQLQVATQHSQKSPWLFWQNVHNRLIALAYTLLK